jgi:hypothetical protein
MLLSFLIANSLVPYMGMFSRGVVPALCHHWECVSSSKTGRYSINTLDIREDGSFNAERVVESKLPQIACEVHEDSGTYDVANGQILLRCLDDRYSLYHRKYAWSTEMKGALPAPLTLTYELLSKNRLLITQGDEGLQFQNTSDAAGIVIESVPGDAPLTRRHRKRVKARPRKVLRAAGH